MAETDDGFLSRWSRRKREDQPRGDADDQAGERSEATGEHAASQAEDEREIVESLPDIETMDDSSDFSVFLQDGVPEALKRRAAERLRRPLRRTRGGGWQEVGWDDALDEAASRLGELRERHGADANALYIGNPMGFDVGAMLYNRIFAEAYGKDAEFFEFYRSLTAYQRSLQGSNSTMVLSPDSEFFNYLKSPTGASKSGE